ncbi:MAG: T9SS type A sorting domain-containing protein [Candidatus Delongbacteria bacterium]|nr:T9SS type A sorting domain-containing protein [Candidatus Delongbacteria bacterium]
MDKELELKASAADSGVQLSAEELAKRQGQAGHLPGESLLHYRFRMGESLTLGEKGLLDAETPIIHKGPGQQTDEGGPDAFGNSWIMTGDEGGPDYTWLTIDEADRNYLTLTDDGVAGPVDLGGVISYYGVSYTQAWIGANGILGFSGTAMNTYTNQTLPAATTPDNLVALFWDDLYPPDGGQIYYGMVGNDFVLTYDGISRLAGDGTLVAQVVLDFDNSAIYCNYDSFDGGIDLSSCTIGIEDPTGTDGLQVIYNSAPFLPTAQTSVRFDLAPPPQFALDLSGPAQIQAASDNTVTATFTVGNAGLITDSYDLSFSGDDLFDYQLQDMEGNPISSVGPVNSLELTTFRLAVTVGGNMGGQSEAITVTATSQGDDQISESMQSTVLVVTTNGSDSFGNTWYSSADPNGTPYFFVELDPQDRTPVTLTDDSVAGPFDMNGTIGFYGTPQTQIYVGSNGMIGFDAAGMTSLSNTAIPTAGVPNGIIALFWDDLNPGSGGSVYYGTDGDGRFVITYDAVVEYGGTGTVRAQVVFDFDNDQIFLNYDALVAPLDVTSCTIGIEDYTGEDGIQVVLDGEPWLPSDDLTLRFELSPPPNYFVALEDGVTATGPADSQVSAFLDVFNQGLLPDSFVIQATADNGVEVDILINGELSNVTPSVAVGDSQEIELELTIPENPAQPNATITVTATSQGDGNRSDETVVLLTIVLVQGGPDAGGYFWSTSDADGAVEYDWVTIENPNPVTLTDDSFVGPFEIGFPWTHYGVEYTEVYIASNGSIAFDPTGLTSLANQQLPNAATPNGVVSFFWDDLNPATGGTVTYGSQDGMFIVTFDQVFEYGGTGQITAQVILDSNEEAVRINYDTLLAPLDILSCTIGQEDASGGQGFSASFDGQGWLPHDQSAIWFGFNVIGPSGPYAVRVRPDNLQGVGLTGGYAEYELEVENRGDNASAFSLVSEGNAWDVTFHDINADWAEITALPVMQYEDLFDLGVRVHVPEVPASFTDLVLLTVESTEDDTAFDTVEILTAASCSHTAQLIQNVNGNGLFGMDHLSDGDWIDANTLVWLASGVNRMVMEDSDTGVVGSIFVLPIGHDYSGIAHDSRDGSFWVSWSGGVSHVSASGALIGAHTPALLDVATGRMPTGLAFDEDGEVLWAICSNGAIDEFVRLDVSDAANPIGLDVIPVPWSEAGGSGAAGLDYNEGSDQLVALHVGTGYLECFLDLGDGSVDARGDFCPSGLSEAHGLALSDDGRLFVGWTNGLAHPVEEYTAPCQTTDVQRDALRLPTAWALESNYPNPFNPSTVIRYALPEQGLVSLDVYNMLGQHMQSLVSGMRPAGTHDVIFDGSSLSSGVYFYRIHVASADGRSLFDSVGKMMLIK